MLAEIRLYNTLKRSKLVQLSDLVNIDLFPAKCQDRETSTFAGSNPGFVEWTIPLKEV